MKKKEKKAKEIKEENMTKNNTVIERFKKKFWTQLIDDYGDEHLYDAIEAFITEELAKAYREGWETGCANSFRKIKAEDPLRIKKELVNKLIKDLIFFKKELSR